MQVICVSRGTYGGGKELAERLAAKLGYVCVGREELTDAATRAGIPVGRMEMAVIKPRPCSERMAVEKDRLVAFMTANLAEQALGSGVVYHGRTGHLVLPNVEHVLRIRAILDAETRTTMAMSRLGLTRDKARAYVEEVDDDRRRWVRTMYNVDWDDPAHYDMVLNLNHVGIENGALALVAMAKLPEFQETPASRRRLEDLALGARCRLAIGNDPRTQLVDVKVRAANGSVTVTYPPRHEKDAGAIAEVVHNVEGVREVLCTMASTNILWIQERYQADSPTLQHILEIAEKWHAAVRLVRLVSDGSVPASELSQGAAGHEAASVPSEAQAGILDDGQEPDEHSADDGGVSETLDRLIQHGRAGGHLTVLGEHQALVQSLDRTTPVSLVIVGNVFLSKGESVRKRSTRELAAFVAESLRVPVIGTDELKTEYLFGTRHWILLLAYLAASAAMFAGVFYNQELVTTFLVRPGTSARVLAATVIVLFVPLFAYTWGHFAQYMLRLFKFE